MSKASQVCLIVAFLAGTIGLGEGWLLRQASDRLDGHLTENQLAESRNQRREAELQGLKLSRNRIASLYDRFHESTTVRTRDVVRESTLGRVNAEGIAEGDAVPPAMQTLVRNGMIFIPGRVLNGENAAVFDGGGSKLEFQKLTGVLADAENANLFLFVDRLVLVRPGDVVPFSLEPTYLETRVSLRFLAEK